MLKKKVLKEINFLAPAYSQKNTTQDIKIGKEKVKLYLHADVIILYIENPKKSI